MAADLGVEGGLRLDFVGAGCNRVIGCADVDNEEGLIAYGSASNVVIADTESATTLCALSGHSGRVNCVRWLPAGERIGELASASSDGTISVWANNKVAGDDCGVRQTQKGPDGNLAQDGTGWRVAHTLGGPGGEGHSDSVTHISVPYGPEAGCRTMCSVSTDMRLLVWSESSSGWEKCYDSTYAPKKRPLCCAAVYLQGGGDLLVATGLADSSVALHGGPGSNPALLAPLCSLQGHKDWVCSVDFTAHPASGDALLATSSHDTNIRVWRITRSSPPPSKESLGSAGSQAVVPPRASGMVRRPKESLTTTQKRHELAVRGKDGEDRSLVALLEAVVVGHEERVTSVRWAPRGGDGRSWGGSDPCILSASMDMSLQLWSPDASDGVWTSHLRVGDIGGAPGALGFYGACFLPRGGGILGHGHNGALQAWGGPSMSPMATVSGHFRGVRDVAWQPGGHYCVSLGDDQTARLFAAWTQGPEASARRRRALAVREGWGMAGDGAGEGFVEVARTQVHGYDLRCLSFLPGCSHAYVCGAEDEKVLRVLSAPQAFVETLGHLAGSDAAKDNESQSRVHTASLPALGLSNKPVAASDPAAGQGTGVEAEEGEEFVGNGYGGAEPPVEPAGVLEKPPTEDMLYQGTLWAELAKLYGHGNSIHCICASHGGSMIASACKAAESQQGLAAIRLWDTGNWLQTGLLDAHKATVTALAFSPDDSFLLSVSRDRSVCVFSKESADACAYSLSFRADKAHERVIWGSSWSPCGKYFVTVSRDRTAKFWGREGDKWQVVGSLPKFASGLTCVDWVSSKPSGNGEGLLAVGTEDGEVSVWGSPGGCTGWGKVGLLLGARKLGGGVTSVRWRPCVDGPKQLAVCGDDHSSRVYTLLRGS